jgi:Protein of unknown function (DUF2934)
MWLIHQLDSLLHLGDCKEYPIMAKAKTPRNGTTKPNGRNPKTPVASAAQPGTTPELRKTRTGSETRRNIVPINLDEEIRRRAYELWEQCGYEPGHENEHWLNAEQEILARYSQESQRTA